MALSTVSDYQDLVNRLLWTWDNMYGGVNTDAIVRNGGVAQADMDDRKAAYDAYKQTRSDFPGGSQAN